MSGIRRTRWEAPFHWRLQTTVREGLTPWLRAIEEKEPAVGAFVDMLPGQALERADALDALESARRGPLQGLPIAVKEIIDVAGALCPLGAPSLHPGRRPATTAALVRMLGEAGAVVTGITVSTEYAIAAAGKTRNPHAPDRTPGGSSSGSAAAVAAGMVPFALGSQTIGSIIRPAAYCGVVGFKPTFGVLSTDGMLILSPALDHAGFIARSVALIRQVMAVMTGMAREPMPFRVRPVAPWFAEPCEPPVRDALADAAVCFRTGGLLGAPFAVPEAVRLAEAGIVETLLNHDLAHRHGATLRGGWERVSDALKALVEAGERIGQSAYQAAVTGQRDITDTLHSGLQPGDVLLAPATTGVAPLFAEGRGERAPQRLWTLAGMPAVTVPVRWEQGLPVGVQLVGRRDQDVVVLNAAAWLERTLARQGGTSGGTCDR
ncbi:MAG: amidase [Ectothiorhodospiraceae bacterium]|nr:amidase [Ectothiorhodospiraceae bacterium]